MSFRGHLRIGQGFVPFTVYRKTGGTTATGRPKTSSYDDVSSFFGILALASPKEKEQWAQLGTPITHTIVQRGTEGRAKENDRLSLERDGETRYFQVQGKPINPGELDHFLIYHVLEREDLQ